MDKYSDIPFEIDGEITKNELKGVLKEAVYRLYTKDGYLIKNGPASPKCSDNHVCERACLFRFAHYLQNILDEKEVLRNLVVDCEYNRNGYDLKRLSAFANGTYPDLIIHHRGDNKGNFLVMEIKSWWNKDINQDKKKIKAFMDKNEGYNDRFGIVLLFEETMEETSDKIDSGLLSITDTEKSD